MFTMCALMAVKFGKLREVLGQILECVCVMDEADRNHNYIDRG